MFLLYETNEVKLKYHKNSNFHSFSRMQIFNENLRARQEGLYLVNFGRDRKLIVNSEIIFEY